MVSSATTRCSLLTLSLLHRRVGVGGRSLVMRRAFSTLSRRAASFRSAAPRTFSTMPRTWGRPAEGPTFHPDFPTEFRPSPIAGVGWWARVDIPKGTLLRRLSVLDGSLVRFKSREDLEAAGWDLCGNQNLRRVRAESTRRPPRHRRDACSMAWRCRFLTARPPGRPRHRREMT